MIIVRISGGLGNQMFEYAFGRALASKNKTELLFDLSGLVAKEGEAQRYFSLDIFNTKYKVATKKDFKTLGIGDPADQTPSARAKRYTRRTYESFFPLEKRKDIIEPEYSFVPEIAALGNNHYFAGIWQSEKYFKNVAQKLREEFTLKKELIDTSIDAAKMLKDKNIVCVNVRRTDYVTDENIKSKIGFAGKKYYENAVSYMLSKIPKAKFLVFSDDIEWCKENLKFIPNVFFISHKSAEKAFAKDFYLMSLCSHYIVANSTFSWWGAWLNQNKNKIVIAPEKWFASGADESDLIPENWIRIQ